MLHAALPEEALPQGMRLMRVEVENHAGGRPPGLTLTESGVPGCCCAGLARPWLSLLALFGGT